MMKDFHFQSGLANRKNQQNSDENLTSSDDRKENRNTREGTSLLYLSFKMNCSQCAYTCARIWPPPHKKINKDKIKTNKIHYRLLIYDKFYLSSWVLYRKMYFNSFFSHDIHFFRDVRSFQRTSSYCQNQVAKYTYAYSHAILILKRSFVHQILSV